MAILSIDRSDEDTFCVMNDGGIVYIGTDLAEIRRYDYTEVIIEAPITIGELEEMLGVK